MSAQEALRWLDARNTDVPDDLRARMQAAMEIAGEGASVSAIMGEAALVCLAAALRAGDDRGGALDLLAADALLTHGAEAAVEEGTDAITAFAHRFGATGLSGLVPEDDA